MSKSVTSRSHGSTPPSPIEVPGHPWTPAPEPISTTSPLTLPAQQPGVDSFTLGRPSIDDRWSLPIPPMRWYYGFYPPICHTCYYATAMACEWYPDPGTFGKSDTTSQPYQQYQQYRPHLPQLRNTDYMGPSPQLPADIKQPHLSRTTSPTSPTISENKIPATPFKQQEHISLPDHPSSPEPSSTTTIKQSREHVPIHYTKRPRSLPELEQSEPLKLDDIFGPHHETRTHRQYSSLYFRPDPKDSHCFCHCGYCREDCPIHRIS